MIKKITTLVFLLSTNYAWAVNSLVTGTVQANVAADDELATPVPEGDGSEPRL